MSTLDNGYWIRQRTMQALGVDPHGHDDTVFGSAFVYCHAHLRAHSTGWCTVGNVDKTPLEAATESEATTEARAIGFRIYGDKP